MALTKPTVGGDNNTWGTILNSALDDLDNRIDNTGAVDGQVAVFDATGTAVPSDFVHAGAHAAGGADRVVTVGGGESANRVDTLHRTFMDGQTETATGSAYLAYVTAQANKTVNRLRVVVGSTGYTAGTGGPPTARLGIYTVASNGDVTLVARTATITAASFTANTVVEANLDSTGGYVTSYDLVYGTRYAFAVIWTDNGATGVTRPQLWRFSGSGPNATIRGTAFGWNPRLSGLQSGQTDLPTSIVSGSVANSSDIFYIAAFNNADSGV